MRTGPAMVADRHRLTDAEWAEVQDAIDKHRQELGDQNNLPGLRALNGADDKLTARRQEGRL